MAAILQKLLGEAQRLKVPTVGRTEDDLRSREAIEAWNAWVRKNGIPYAEYRHF